MQHEAPPDAAERARWRRRALDWLRADLDGWSRLARDGPPKERPSAAQALGRWKGDPDLAGARDEAGIRSLPEAERKEWRDRWVEVDRVREQAERK